MKEKIKHIFFDLDNTLWDHRGNSVITLEEMFSEYQITQKYGVSFESWHEVFYRENELLWQKLNQGKISKKELREQRFKIPFLYFDINPSGLSDFFENEYLKRMTQKTKVVEGAEEILNYLYPHYNLHIITNGFAEVSSAKVERSVLNGYFKTLTCADEIGVRKPHPKLFDRALSKASAKKENTVLIGDDWEADVIGALNYGIEAIYFNDLKKEVANNKVREIQQLTEIKSLL